DKGAHGKAAVEGYGYIIEHPNAIISSLSEEVGKIILNSGETIKLGEKIRIIPNHSCVVCNNISFAVLHEDEDIRGLIHIDMRNGSRKVFPEISVVKDD
ncbi:MAG TPA: hypothetical protein ENK81_00500, partial [Euryarchaeota archaeon]|nr:hypothetical protein [Euryarchaeota archaeon]